MREGIAALVGVREEPWAAACVPPTGVLWLLLSLQRGVLQGLGAYAPVGLVGRVRGGRAARRRMPARRARGRRGGRVPRHAARDGGDVASRSRRWCTAAPRRTASPVVKARAHELRTLVVAGWAPIVGLLLLAALQNVDVIMAKREMTASDAGAYAAAVVAAKLVVWVAIGIGLHLLPEATRRVGGGGRPATGPPARARPAGDRRGAVADHLHGRARDPAARRVRRGVRQRGGRAADPRPGDDAPGRVDARRAVHARAAPDGVPLRARGRGDRRAAAAERRRRRDAVVRGDRARRPGRRGGGVSRARPAARARRRRPWWRSPERWEPIADAPDPQPVRTATSRGRRRSARRRRP